MLQLHVYVSSCGKTNVEMKVWTSDYIALYYVDVITCPWPKLSASLADLFKYTAALSV